MRRHLKNNRGSALLISLALILMLSGVAMMAIDRATTDIDLSYNQLHSDQAFYIAEAGIEYAISAINADNTWRDGVDKKSLGNGTFTVTITDSATDSTLADTILLRSRGEVDGAVANLEVSLLNNPANPFERAIFGDEYVKLAQDGCTDSYNSDSGTYMQTLQNEAGSIGANGYVDLAQDATVNGDINTATPGSINTSQGTTITGDTSTSAPSETLNLIPDSEYDWAKSVSNAPAGLTGDFQYSPGTKNLYVKQDDSVTLSSGVYFFNLLKLEQNAHLSIAPGANVTIYMTGDLLVGQDGSINNGGKPKDIAIYSKGEHFQLGPGNTFYGVFYGPRVPFVAGQDASMYGSIIAKSLHLAQNDCFHYDRDLANFTKGFGSEFNIVAWRQM